MDVFTKKKRSAIMAKINSKGTKIELLIFRELRREKIHFQRHYKRAVGSPDIALPRKKKAVFIDGDFWHGWRFNKEKSRLPRKYWRTKIETNIKRDKYNTAKLRRMGWKVMRIWEHDLTNARLVATLKKIKAFLK